MEEIWKDIPGYEGRYQASTMGRIKSLDRVVKCGPNRRLEQHVKERILRPGRYDKTGHVSVTLGHKAIGSHVHNLVMKTFVGEPLPGQEVCHNNGDPTDNRLENLRYDTKRENVLDVYRQGKTRRKLTINDALSIRKRLSNGEKAAALSKAYGVCESTIRGIGKRKIFGWVPEES